MESLKDILPYLSMLHEIEINDEMIHPQTGWATTLSCCASLSLKINDGKIHLMHHQATAHHTKRCDILTYQARPEINDEFIHRGQQPEAV